MGYNEVMFFTSLFGWWYGKGWRGQFGLVFERLAKTSDFFSISLLAKSLFAPFRQISAGNLGSSAPIGVRFQAFLDKLFSRFMGAIVRMIVIILGFLALLLSAVLGLGWLLVWPLMPFLPIIGFLVSVTGALAL